MQSLWKLVNKPRVDDWSPLAKFYYADEALNAIASELDSFDGRRDPERCNHLVNKLRQAQDRVLHIIAEMLIIVFPHEADRASRDFRLKFPDEIVHDTLPGQLWFGAECLAAGSNIVDKEAESDAIRPMAKALTKHLDKMREMLKDQSLKDPSQYPDRIKGSLKAFDQMFADFEFAYVSAMVSVKSAQEHDCQLDVAVLFSESLARAIRQGYINQEQIDDCEPNVMIALPRLAIVWGLLYWPEGALNVDGSKEKLSEMFRYFYKLLRLIRGLLRSLSAEELRKLEGLLVTGNSSEAGDCAGQTSLRTLESEIESLPGHSSLATSLSSTPPAPPAPPSTATAARGSWDSELYGNQENILQRLFVCISGVADQLQTNYSADVRKVLKMVLQPMEAVPVYEVSGETARVPENEEETGIEVQESLPIPSFVGVRWVPDGDCEQCTACQSPFTLVRRRHHCRNCGRIFCGGCSANQLPIPELGYERKVRVCNLCFIYKINPFSAPGRMADGAQHSPQQTVQQSNMTSTPLLLEAPSSSCPPLQPSSSSSSTTSTPNAEAALLVSSRTTTAAATTNNNRVPPS